MDSTTDFNVILGHALFPGNVDGHQVVGLHLKFAQPGGEDFSAVFVLDSQDALELSKHLRECALEVPSINEAPEAGEEIN